MIGWYSKEKKALIEPKRFAPENLNFVRLGIIVFVRRVYEWMKAAVHNIAVEKSDGIVGAINFFATKDGLAVFHSYFGAPAATELAEALIAGGIKKLIIFGEAGSINPKIGLGEILLPTFAVREEGTSYHYIPSNVTAKPSPTLAKKLKALLEEKGLSFKEGGLWTTDAPFRETRDKLLKYSKRGVFAVEMECSALFSVARYRRAKSAAALIITDELYRKRWKPAFEEPKVLKIEKEASEVLVKNWFKLL